MSEQATVHSPEFKEIIAQVETALIQAAEDARLLAERTGTPLVVRESAENQACGNVDRKAKPVQDSDNAQ